MKRFLIGLGALIFLIFLIILAYYLVHSSNKPSSNANMPVKTVKAQTEKEVSCTRTIRLQNSPQYDRALSLIAQRIDDYNKYSFENLKFKYFPTQLTNCIKVTETNVANTTGAEGYFTFNSKDIRQNYYPISVDASYSLTDDVLTALLLSHEMTHVQQYINQLNGKESLACYDKEIEAFMAQLDFYLTLYAEEDSSAYYRIQNDENLHPQLQMIKTMTTINRDSNCDIMDKNCKDTNLRTKLKEMLMQNETYKKECTHN